jgi:hypothetical protein
LRANLERTFELVVEERKTLETYPLLRQSVVDETTLRDYYTGEDPTTEITQSWYAVKRRVLSEFRQRENRPAADRVGSRWWSMKAGAAHRTRHAGRLLRDESVGG